MKSEIIKLNFNINDFKSEYWYAKVIEIPQFIKNVEPNITEEELFDKLLINVFQTCDLFINQRMSQFLALDISLDQIKDILGKQRIKNFISSVYTEIKYRLATEKFPEFSQKDKLLTSSFSLASAGRDFSSFQSLLSPEAIAYLTYPSWNDLKAIENDDYFNIVSIIEKLNKFDNKIEKLLNANSESDENLKLAFSQFKTNQLNVNSQINELIKDIDSKKENKLSEKVQSFLTNIISNPTTLGDSHGDDYLTINFGFSGDNIGISLKEENGYSVDISSGGIVFQDDNSSNDTNKIIIDGSDIVFRKEKEIETPSGITREQKDHTLNYKNVELLFEAKSKTISLEEKLNSLENTINNSNLASEIASLKTANNSITSKLNNHIASSTNEIEALKERDRNFASTYDQAIGSLNVSNSQLSAALIGFIKQIINKNKNRLILDFVKSDYTRQYRNDQENLLPWVGTVVQHNQQSIYLISYTDEDMGQQRPGWSKRTYTYVIL